MFFLQRKLDEIPDDIHDEIFELCERLSDDEEDDSDANDHNLHEIIQKRAEDRVAGRLIKELKTALVCLTFLCNKFTFLIIL